VNKRSHRDNNRFVPRRHWIVDAAAGLVVCVMLLLWIVTRLVHSPDSHIPTMPEKVTDSAENELYLEPGGLYTLEDIEENGRLTASQKYVGFIPAHDANPKPGEPICPITRTKANPECSWIIGGNRYQFCCPPCIDEFLQKAKSSSSQMEHPSFFIQD